MHYAFNLPGWEEGAEYTQLVRRRNEGNLTRPWPLWPPDMFAAVATLLEQSGSYLRMVHCDDDFDTNGSDNHEYEAARFEFDATKVVDLAASGRTLALPDETLKICRIIGALWREGCLFISGDNGMKTMLPPNTETENLTILRLRENCRNALADLELRFRREFHEGEIGKICDSARDWYLRERMVRVGTPGHPKYNIDPRIINENDFILPQYLANELLEESADYDRPELGKVPKKYAGRYEIVLCMWAIEYIAALWSRVDGQAKPYILDHQFKENVHDWQVACTLLLAIADEAARGIGFSQGEATGEVLGGIETKPVPEPLPRNIANLKQNDLVGLTCRDLWQTHLGFFILKDIYPRNLARCLDESVATVMPKARVPSAGCTIRSLSHHLALLPPKGRIRTRWAQQRTVAEHPTYNLLLIPFPFEIRSSDVVPLPGDLAHKTKEWGRFSIVPDWMRRAPQKHLEKWGESQGIEQLVKFVTALIADQPEGVINGIVFPEGALTEAAFKAIAKTILSEPKWNSIALLTSGITDWDGKPGNFVATAMRSPGSSFWQTWFARAKHHRWSLNANQLKSYALSNRLPPHRVWWENIPLTPREMLFTEFSKGSILTSLICEDLARIDPCQAALRAVGPNLTLVLLMDSAQISSRWPAQYAGVLADDPGTSVLTLTSFGLLRRSNLSDGHASRAIALWREPLGGGARQIDLPVGYQAQLLSLRRERHREVTLDGRGDGTSAVIWKLAGVVPIRVDEGSLPPGYPLEG
jgi:hypothetical protein